jgi:hypothetical protein
MRPSSKVSRRIGNSANRAAAAIHAVYLSERRLSARLRVFIDCLADAFRGSPWNVDKLHHRMSVIASRILNGLRKAAKPLWET